MEFTVGAAEFEVRQLGNAGCRYVAFKGGVGEVSLDFSGDRLRETTHLLVNVGLGEVRIRVPESVGIRLDADRFLASVDHEGLIKRGRYYVSPDYDAAASTLVIEVNAVLGSIELERVP
jgi:predicted membrane protein